MRRSMLYLFVALVLAALASTCGPTQGPPETVVEQPQPEATEDATHPATEVVEEATQPVAEPSQDVVSFWMWVSTPFEQEAVERMVNQFSEETGISVNLQLFTH